MGTGSGELPRPVDGLVRLVISHATSPGEPAELAAVQAEWLVRGFLAGPGALSPR